jgi:hypothetical protein
VARRHQAALFVAAGVVLRLVVDRASFPNRVRYRVGAATPILLQ